jgi:hypothetical protein
MDPRLDVSSLAFDALYALNQPDLIVLPYPNINPLDNLAQYHSKFFPKAPAATTSRATEPAVAVTSQRRGTWIESDLNRTSDMTEQQGARIWSRSLPAIPPSNPNVMQQPPQRPQLRPTQRITGHPTEPSNETHSAPMQLGSRAQNHSSQQRVVEADYLHDYSVATTVKLPETYLSEQARPARPLQASVPPKHTSFEGAILISHQETLQSPDSCLQHLHRR